MRTVQAVKKRLKALLIDLFVCLFVCLHILDCLYWM